mgnify:CR=1 FL=1
MGLYRCPVNHIDTSTIYQVVYAREFTWQNHSLWCCRFSTTGTALSTSLNYPVRIPMRMPVFRITWLKNTGGQASMYKKWRPIRRRNIARLWTGSSSPKSVRHCHRHWCSSFSCSNRSKRIRYPCCCWLRECCHIDQNWRQDTGRRNKRIGLQALLRWTLNWSTSDWYVNFQWILR